MRKCLLLLAAAVASLSVHAQSEKEKKAYADEAAQLQKQVWDNPVNEFKSTSVPAGLQNESAVVLARSYSFSRSSSGKFKFGHAITFTTRTAKFSVYHERVKINDKSALEGFSTLEYQKILNQTTSSGFAKYVDVNNTYVGAKVVKPTGKEVVVNTGEEVLTKNESKDKQGKLAIPDLQVGDVLDYYLCEEVVADKEEGNTYKDNDNVLFLQDEYPILYFGIDFQFNKKINVKTIYANGAQHFEITQNNEGDQVYSLKLHNVPKFKGQIWTSAYRQYPYIEIGSSYNDDLDKIIQKNNFTVDPMLNAQKYIFENMFNEISFPFQEDISKLKDYYKDSKSLKNAPVDSIVKNLYAVWRFNRFCYYFGEEISNPADLKQRRANGKPNAINMCMALTDLKIDHDILLVSSRNSNSLNNVFNLNDFDALIRVNSDKPMYMCFDDITTQFNEIPDRFQGEKVIVLHPKRHSRTSYTFDESEATLPVTTSDKNHIDEFFSVTPSATDIQKLQIDRRVTEDGAMRNDQISLLTMRDIDAGIAGAVKVNDFQSRYKQIGNSKKFAKSVQDALDKEKGDQDKYFKDEIKSKFEQEPKEVGQCKIVHTGVDVSSPQFEFTESFSLENLVKRAGNNYIIDAGKLTGGFLKLEEKNKTRDVDVYMDVARSFNYTIVINVPAGYTVKDMEEMTGSKTNKTGSFSSSAVLNGNKLTITVKRVYAHNFEKTADWPLMVDLINAASDFDSKKILLEKVN